MLKKIKSKKPVTPKSFISWNLTFTQFIMKLVTQLWSIGMIYAAVLICFAIYKVDNFSFLDTYITEICSVFKASVISICLKSTVENVFRYNDIFGKRQEYRDYNLNNNEFDDV